MKAWFQASPGAAPRGPGLFHPSHRRVVRAAIIRGMPGSDNAADIPSLTQRLNALRGDGAALGAELPALVYAQLKQLAHRQLAREHGAARTLSTTALVHEAWLQIDGRQDWIDRGHFYRYAATAMRHILVDQARRRLAGKRGSGIEQLELDAVVAPAADIAADMIGLDRILSGLERSHPQLSQVVEMRFFAGLSVAETALGLGISERSVVRNWRMARAMIHRALEKGGAA